MHRERPDGLAASWSLNDDVTDEETDDAEHRTDDWVENFERHHRVFLAGEAGKRIPSVIDARAAVPDTSNFGPRMTPESLSPCAALRPYFPHHSVRSARFS